MKVKESKIVRPFRPKEMSDLEYKSAFDKYVLIIESKYSELVDKINSNNSIMKNWFKIVVSLFLSGALFLGWGYVQAQKDIALNGRYLFNPASYGYECVIDTRTGIVYKINSQFSNGSYIIVQKDQLPE